MVLDFPDHPLLCSRLAFCVPYCLYFLTLHKSLSLMENKMSKTNLWCTNILGCVTFNLMSVSLCLSTKVCETFYTNCFPKTAPSLIWAIFPPYLLCGNLLSGLPQAHVRSTGRKEPAPARAPLPHLALWIKEYSLSYCMSFMLILPLQPCVWRRPHPTCCLASPPKVLTWALLPRTHRTHSPHPLLPPLLSPKESLKSRKDNSFVLLPRHFLYSSASSGIFTSRAEDLESSIPDFPQEFPQVMGLASI